MVYVMNVSICAFCHSVDRALPLLLNSLFPCLLFLYLNKFVFWVTFLLSYFVISHIFVS